MYSTFESPSSSHTRPDKCGHMCDGMGKTTKLTQNVLRYRESDQYNKVYQLDKQHSHGVRLMIVHKS